MTNPPHNHPEITPEHTQKKNHKPLDEQNKSVTPYTREKVREIIRDNLATDSDPSKIIDELGKNLFPRVMEGNKKEKEIATKEFNERHREIISLGELDNHYFISESVSKEYRPMLIDMARQLHAEYGVEKPSEKGLVELAVGAFGRYLEYSTFLHRLLGIEYLSSEKNGYYGLIAKESDRAHRQYLTAISALKQARNPGFEININAKTAMLGQYQQVNEIQEDKQH